MHSRATALALLVAAAPVWAQAEQLAAGQEWNGRYRCAQGDTPLIVQIREVSTEEAETRSDRGVRIRAAFFFGGRGKPNGGFYLNGHYVPQTGEVELVPERWIQRPTGYTAVGMTGRISDDGNSFTGRIDGPFCSDFSLTRAPSAKTARAPQDLERVQSDAMRGPEYVPDIARMTESEKKEYFDSVLAMDNESWDKLPNSTRCGHVKNTRLNAHHVMEQGEQSLAAYRRRLNQDPGVSSADKERVGQIVASLLTVDNKERIEAIKRELHQFGPPVEDHGLLMLSARIKIVGGAQAVASAQAALSKLKCP